MSHAVRIGWQAVEYLETGEITFPSPNASHLLRIKQGELPYQAVSEEVERLLDDVECAAEDSGLPAQPDRAWIDDFVMEHYRRMVTAT